MKRLINFRAFLVIALFMIAIILLCAFCLVKNARIGLLLIVIFLIVAALSTLLIALFSNKKKYIFTFVLVLLFSCVSIFNFLFTIGNWTTNIIDKTVYSVEGTIETVINSDFEANQIIIKNLKINNKLTKGKLAVFLDDNNLSEINEGFKIKFSAHLYTNEIISGEEIKGNVYRSDIRYKAFLSHKDVYLTPQKLTGRDKILSTIRSKLISALGEQYGSISYSMLTGDKNKLDDTVVNYFSVSGLGHIMAVSGLHIGFIVLLITFAAKKLKIHKKFYIPFIFVVFVLYILLIGLSPSIIRAVIMCTVGLLTQFTGRRKDMLSSLSLAVCVILLISPLFLFEAGFVLSVSAVFGLILFANTFEKAMRKIHFPKFITAPLSLSISVQIGIIPAMAFYFNQFQVYSILINIVLMPLIMITFIGMLITLLLSLLLAPLTVLLQIAGIGLAIIDAGAHLVSLLPYSSVMTYSSVLLFSCYGLYFLISKFFMLPKFKKITSALLAVICVIIIIIPNFYLMKPSFNSNDEIVIPIFASNDVTSIVYDNGKTLIIGDLTNAKAVKYALSRHKILTIDTIVLFELSSKVANQLIYLDSMYNIGQIFCPKNSLNDGLDKLSENNIKCFYIFDDVIPVKNLLPVSIENKVRAFTYSFTKLNALFSSNKYNYNVVPIEIINKSALIRCSLYLNEFPDRIYLTNFPIGAIQGEIPVYQYSTASNEFAFDVNKGLVYQNKNL